jgi:hypothetical protein
MVRFKTVSTPWDSSDNGKSLQWLNGSYNKYWWRPEQVAEYEENLSALQGQGHNYGTGTENGKYFIQLLSFGRHRTTMAGTDERVAVTVRYFEAGDESGTLHKLDFLTEGEYNTWKVVMGTGVEIFSENIQ